ncbi:MAG: hypothetical protein CFE21_14990 [Bacteroidetes bacterium B1(2017)]|nr:MAG: hypothetical protein CFE21_14990 [Bacteroidetes bacterium B1(2017)]
MVKRKLKEWLKRYLPAEIVGTITALAAASITHYFTYNLILIAYAASLAEAIGFYSTVFIQQLMHVINVNKTKNILLTFKDLSKIIRNILLEFGVAGLLDDLTLRPFFMYVFPILLNNFALGILVGKLVGDLSFYCIAILSYELKNRVDISRKNNTPSNT